MIFQRAIESKEYMANSKAMLSKLRSLKKSLAISSVLTLITGLILFLLPTQSIAANLDISAFTVKTNPDGTQDYSLSLQVVILMTLLSFLPSILVMMTSFTRIVIVLAILRQAIGLQTSPSNQVLIGIAFFMTIFVMTPVFDDMYTQAIEPYMNDKIQARDAFEIAHKGIREVLDELFSGNPKIESDNLKEVLFKEAYEQFHTCDETYDALFAVICNAGLEREYLSFVRKESSHG